MHTLTWYSARMLRTPSGDSPLSLHSGRAPPSRPHSRPYRGCVVEALMLRQSALLLQLVCRRAERGGGQGEERLTGVICGKVD